MLAGIFGMLHNFQVLQKVSRDVSLGEFAESNRRHEGLGCIMLACEQQGT